MRSLIERGKGGQYDDCYIKIKNAIDVIKDSLDYEANDRRKNKLRNLESQVMDITNEVDDAVAATWLECPEVRQLRTPLTDVEESYIKEILDKHSEYVVLSLPLGAKGSKVPVLLQHIRR